MKEIKQKFIDTIKSIDFAKLSITDICMLADAIPKIKDIDSETSAYLKAMSDTLASGLPKPAKETLQDLR